MDIKDVTSWLGIEADNLDKFKEQFQQKYLTEEQILKDKEVLGKFTGKTLGKISTELTRIGRAQGIEFTKDEVEGKTIEEMTNLFLTKQAQTYTSQIEDLKKVASSSGDEKAKEWESKFEKLQNKYKDTEGLLKKTSEEFEGFKQIAAQQVKGVKLDYVRNNVWSSVKFDPTVDQLKKKGFEATIKEQYVIDLDENDNPFIATKEGKRIPSPQRHDQFLSVEEVLNMEAEKAGLTAKNPKAGQPAFFTPSTQQVNTPQPKPGRRIHSRANVGG